MGSPAAARKSGADRAQLPDGLHARHADRRRHALARGDTIRDRGLDRRAGGGWDLRRGGVAQPRPARAHDRPTVGVAQGANHQILDPFLTAAASDLTPF